MLEIRKVARRTKSCSKSEKLLKSCRATSGQPYSRPDQLPKEKPNDNNPNNFSSIKLTRKKEHMSHSYYLTPIEPSFQYLSICPLEQTVKFVCSSLNVTNPKNPKAFKMHPQPNKLFQTYQNQLIFRLQVVTTLFKISVNHSTSA